MGLGQKGRMIQEEMAGRPMFVTGMKGGITTWLGGCSQALLFALQPGPILIKCLLPSLRFNILSCKIGIIISTTLKVWVEISDNVSKVAVERSKMAE